MNLLEATINALQGKLEEKPNKDNAKINSKILEPITNRTELQRNGYNVERNDGFTTVKRADRVNDFREVDVFDDGTVMVSNDNAMIDEPVNKEAFDAKSFLDTNRKKPYEAPSKVSKFKLNKDTVAQADEEISKAEVSKAEHPEDAEILDKNVIEPWKKLKNKADAENKEMLKKTENSKFDNAEEIKKLLNDAEFMKTLHITPADVKKQVEISEKDFNEISEYVKNYKGTFGELYKELQGWNLGDKNVEQDNDNLFDCYYKSLLITVHADDGKLTVSPHDVYVYAKDISDVDADEILHIDFDKPINFPEEKKEEGRRVLGERKIVEVKGSVELKSAIDDLEQDMMFTIGTDEGVENNYADSYKDAIDMAKSIIDEHNGSEDIDDLINDLEKKQSEIYTDVEDLMSEKDLTDAEADDIIDGWYQAFDDVIQLVKKFYNKAENKNIQEAKECLKEETLTWEDIMDNAEGTTFGQQVLKVKDTARDCVEQLLIKDGVDIDSLESVEDEIEKYCKDNNIKFDTHGNLVTECNKVTEGIKVGDKIKIVTYNNHPDEDLLDWADKQSTDIFEVTEVDNDGKIFHIKDCEYGIPFDSDDYITVKDKVTEDVAEDLDEAFYEKICRAYIDTLNLEWVTTNPENNNSVVHGYFADDNTAEKWDYGAKVTPKNFKDVAYEGHTDEEIENGDVEWYEYDTWEDFYEEYVKENIDYDMYDIGVFDYQDNWDFYIPEADLRKLGLWNDDMLKDFLGESKKQEATELSVKDRLYNEIKRRYKNLDSLCQRLQEPPYKIYDEDYTALQAVLDVFDGVELDENKKTESVVSDYTLSEIKKVLDSEETEYGYSLKITNSGADEETRTLDLDKSDLQAIYDALSKNKVTESKLEETVENSTDKYTTKSYYIELPNGMFGVSYTNKDKAIKTFTDLIAKEKNMDSEHWNKQAQEYEQLIADGKVQVVTVTTNSEEITTAETLKLDNGSVQLGEAKVYTPDNMGEDYDNYINTFNKLQNEIKNLSDANLDYKGMCSLIAGYIEGIVGVEDNKEAMAKVNIDTVREIADAVFNEDDVWEPMDDFIYSTIYEKLGIE